MSFDESAINAIRDLTYAQEMSNLLSDNRNAASLQVVLPSGYSLADLEKYETRPKRFRGEFKTHLIDEFVAYVNSNGNDNTGIFVDAERSKATAIIDMGKRKAPEWGDHKATIGLKKTPAFEKLLANQENEFDQLAFIDFIEDWLEYVVFLEDASGQDKPMQLTIAITSIRKLTISSTSDKTSEAGDFKASHSQFDSIELKASGNKPPKGFDFHCTPYDGLIERHFNCRLRAITNGKEVKLKYRIIALDSIMDNIGLEFKQALQDDTKVEGAQFYCGEMNYQTGIK